MIVKFKNIKGTKVKRTTDYSGDLDMESDYVRDVCSLLGKYSADCVPLDQLASLLHKKN